MLIALALASSLVTQTPAAPLRIVVIEGEGAVNIIQQKTAVRPLVEVRDRNNVPVSGATVTFAVNGQPAAFANGATTMTVTTNAQGQAAAAGFNAVRPGAVQIQVSAAHQGQTAAAMISQTNFATAAAATAAGVAAGAAATGGAAAGGGAATAGATGGAAAAGGGMSATTIGIIGAAVAGGAVAATTVAKKDEGGDDQGVDGYNGTLSGQIVLTLNYVTVNTPQGPCTSTNEVTGTVRMEMNGNGNGTGKATVSYSQRELSVSGQNCLPNTTVTWGLNADVSGFSFSGTASVGQAGAGPVGTYTVNFRGSQTGATISGSMTIDMRSTGPGGNTGSGSTSIPVTLTR